MAEKMNPLKIDPTRTKMLRVKFEKDLRRRFKLLNKKLYKLIVEDDAFGLAPKKSIVQKMIGNQITTNVREWEFLSDPQKLAEFERWLSNETGLLIVPEDNRFWESYVEQGYEKGAGRAFAEGNKKALAAGIKDHEVFLAGRQSEFITTMLGAPETVEKVQLLAGRVLTDLKGVNAVMATQLRKELVDGLVTGSNPKTIARGIADRVLGQQKTKGGRRIGNALYRAEVIARTEVIRAHAEGQLDALERMGITEVGVSVEWSTAGDTRVCPLCNDLEGVVLKTKESHGILPRHPQCRCSWIPANVGESQEKQIRSKTAIDKAFDNSIRKEGGKKRTLEEAKKTSRWAGKSKTIEKARPKSILDD